METFNYFGVGVRGNEITIMRRINGAIEKDHALNLAAWLVACADDDGKFEALLKKVRET